MPVSFVTPSTRPATSSPNSSRTSSSEALVSSTVSCRSAAHSVSVSRRMPAQILATPTGWVMKSSPDWRRWSAWCSQAKTNASDDAAAVDLAGDLVRVLLDDGEEVGEQLALDVREVRRARRPAPGADGPGGRPACDRGRRPRRASHAAAAPGRCRRRGRARWASARAGPSSGARAVKGSPGGGRPEAAMGAVGRLRRRARDRDPSAVDARRVEPARWPSRPPGAAGTRGTRPSAPASVRAGSTATRTPQRIALQHDEPELGEHAQEPPRQRRRSAAGAPGAAQQRLEHAALRAAGGAQRPVELGERGAQIGLPREHAAGEGDLGAAPRQVRPAVAGKSRQQRLEVRVGRRIERDDMVVAAPRAPGRPRAPPMSSSAKPPTRVRSADARWPACAQTTSTGSPEATRSPSSPAMPVPRASRSVRPGAARVRVVACREPECRRRSRSVRGAASATRRPRCADRTRSGHGSSGRASSATTPAAKAPRPRARSAPGGAGRAWRRTSRGSTAPL